MAYNTYGAGGDEGLPGPPRLPGPPPPKNPWDPIPPGQLGREYGNPSQPYRGFGGGGGSAGYYGASDGMSKNAYGTAYYQNPYRNSSQTPHYRPTTDYSPSTLPTPQRVLDQQAQQGYGGYNGDDYMRHLLAIQSDLQRTGQNYSVDAPTLPTPTLGSINSMRQTIMGSNPYYTQGYNTGPASATSSTFKFRPGAAYGFYER